MPYRSTPKTRRKKDAKRTAMMQAAVQIFAEKGYHAANVRDIVAAANVSVGTFYFYFPDKETLFLHLYEETADFLGQTLQQAMSSREALPRRIRATLQAYVNIAVYEPAVVQLLLVSGVGAVLSPTTPYTDFRESLIALWQRPIETALAEEQIPPQSGRRTAEALTGAINEVIVQLLGRPHPEREAETAVRELTHFVLRALGLREMTGP